VFVKSLAPIAESLDIPVPPKPTGIPRSNQT
jgi:hypothetical protein